MRKSSPRDNPWQQQIGPVAVGPLTLAPGIEQKVDNAVLGLVNAGPNLHVQVVFSHWGTG